MKKWLWAVLVILLFIGGETDSSVSSEREELPEVLGDNQESEV
ncbi:hypothetical protein [Sporosarcina sp. Te-1]|nr:hypothetical protein [Sporosarcina sp. Te-1]